MHARRGAVASRVAGPAPARRCATMLSRQSNAAVLHTASRRLRSGWRSVTSTPPPPQKRKGPSPEVLAKREALKALMQRMNYRVLELGKAGARRRAALLHLNYAEGEDSQSTLAAAAADPDYDPELWSVLWPSAIAASEELARQPELVQGGRVVELGSGLGLPGIVAGLCGAESVLLTDVEETALKLGLTSAKLNALPLHPSNAGRSAKLNPFPADRMLSWAVGAGTALEDGDGSGWSEVVSDEDREEQGIGMVGAAKFCWVSDTVPAEPQDQQPGVFKGCADVIIACDVLYSDEAVGCLASVVQQLLVPGGVFILADPAGAVAGVEEQVRGRAMELMKVLATEGAASGRPLSLACLPVSMSVPIEGSEPADVDVIIARIGKR